MVLVAAPLALEAQPRPTRQVPKYAIQGARIVTVSGQTIDNGTVVIGNAVITAVGRDVHIPAGAWVIDGSGKTVYPPLDAALDAVIKNGAEMLGLDDRIGAIEVGKMANVIVTDGNPLEIQPRVTELFILDRQVSTHNKHQSLYDKYRSRRGRVIS
jgi:imidazolonepropionase-like amidohydrolase